MNSPFLLGSVTAALGFFMLFKKLRLQQENKDTKSLSPPLPSLSRNWKHHVFPSFHGADVRKTFLSHILESFRRKGIDPLIDNHIERGKSIGPELIEAIRGSKIAIVLFSKNYASSSWCLDELVEIMKCREVLGQTVMTIFYEVDPIDIRKQTGDFGRAFRKNCKRKSKKHIERWRKALEDVAQITGTHSRNWSNEVAMIEEIATNVSNMLNFSTPSRDFDGLVGIRAHMERMEQLLCLDLDEVRMIGVWGPPGIGKTTIARFMFNQFSRRFQLGAIMDNIKGSYPRPCLDEYGAQLQLQSQMLSRMINQKDITISHLGVAQERLKDKKVLLVLDDVDQLGQLDALAKESRWFGPRSRIIITTENLRVLNAHRINHIYKVNFPSSVVAFQIFCMYAFGKKIPYEGFYELAWEVTNLAGQLPLGLKVLGSSLRGMSKKEWKRTLPRLKTRLDGEIESIIKFSYDALCDEDKDLFLYIACIFKCESIHIVEEILANNFLDVRQGLHVLAEKSLIYIENGRIKMHTLLEQFGRETSRKQFIHGFAKRQLLVGTRDICEVLNDDTTDSRRFIGIRLDFTTEEEEFNISEKTLERMFDLQFVRIWFYSNNHADPKSMHFRSSVLQGLIYHSRKMRSLYWQGYHNICLPSTFHPEFLVELVMCNSKLQKLWEETKSLKNLKWMDLSHSEELKELPDLSSATNLQELILLDCSSLVKLPSSIGKLTSLQILDLQYCSSLLKLPSSIGKLTSLQTLKLKRCSSLVELPFSLGNATNLQTLGLSSCSSLTKLPSSIMNAINLKYLDLFNCSNLVEVPSIGNAIKLKKLHLDNCSSLRKLPSSIDATNLHNLFLENCTSLMALPAIENATNLKTVTLINCSSLLELPPSIGNTSKLEQLKLRNCSRLRKLPSSIDATNLHKLFLKNCSSLQELPAMENATNLETLMLINLSSLLELPSSIGTATNLEKLDIRGCSSLVELPSSIENLQQLSELIIDGCSSLVELPTNINLKSLHTLVLVNCSQLKIFPEISTNIENLSIVGTAIKDIPFSLMSWSRLSNFHMSYFESLNEFPHALDLITVLHLVREEIQELPPWVKGISHLRELRLNDCNNLVLLPQLSVSLYEIFAHNCKSLERLDCSFNNPDMCLKFINCFKLNQEARDFIMHTSTRAILPGTEVPACFNYQAIAGSSVTIKLNERPLPTTVRFKACIITAKCNKEIGNEERSELVFIDIHDKKNDRTVQSTPRSHLIDRLLTEHIYIFEFEVQEVTSPELVFEIRLGNRYFSKKWKIGEWGLQILEVPSC